ncbi:MAG: DUF3857 domain-containing protein [Bacteroidota bacterium]
MKNVLFISLLLSVFCVKAQSDWVENRSAYPVAVSEENVALSYLSYTVHYDYKYNQEGRFICDVTYHVIARANNDDGLESMNRIYISLNNVIDVLDIKSRVITKEGKTVELDQSNIKEVEDEQTKGGYRIFAVEGAEIGGEIEYRYTKRVHGSTFINERIQFQFPVQRLEFTLTCPENLEYEFKVVNDEIEVNQIDTTDTRNRYQVVMTDIPAYTAEPFSGLDANKKRIDFRLAYNSAAGKKRINTYADAGKRIYENAHDLSKEDQKVIDNFIKEHDDNDLEPINRLKKLEHELKQKFYMEDNSSDKVADLFSNGFASKKAFLKLFVAIVEYLKIDFEIVATSDRSNSKFESDFTSWNYLDDFLIYFPSENKFLSVHDYRQRYGSVTPNNTAISGIFIRPEPVQDFVYPVTRLSSIPATSYKANMNNLDIKVSFDDDISKAIVKAKRIYIGNEANYYKSALFWMDEEQSNELLKDLAKFLAGDGDILNVELSEANNSVVSWDEPYIIDCYFENEHFIEYAGNSVLFKVGELIGLQSELYKDEERKFEVENTHNRGYLREITIKIPEGYGIENLNDLVLNEKVVDQGKPVYLFESSYEMEKDQLKIRIDEYYDKIFFPKSRFEEFRKVINAAADWNKVTLVLKEIN